jgi:hypothetical protein
MNAFLLSDVLENVLEALDEVLNLLHEPLLIEFFDNVFFLLESCHGLVTSEVGTKGIDQHREHMVVRGNIFLGSLVVQIIRFLNDFFNLD